MSRSLRDDIVGNLDSVASEWARLSRETQDDVRKMNEYYGGARNFNNKDEVFKKAEEDSQKIKNKLSTHQTVSAKANNLARDLQTQDESSENGAKRMKKYGLTAAVAFTVLGGVIGLAFGMKYPGLGQPIAIVVAVVVGIVAFGLFAFTLYLFMKTKAERKAKMWRTAKTQNEEGIEMAKVIEKKRRVVNDIHSNLKDLQPDNYDNAIKEILEGSTEYLQ